MTTNPIPVRLDEDTEVIVRQFAAEDGIPLATFIRSLVKTHPRVREKLLELLRKRRRAP